MPHGGKLTWAVKNVAVTTQDTAHGQGIPVGNYVAIEVTDTGCGIPADLIGRIFEPFFSTKSGRGNGTGLSIVYDAIIKMNGHILVESEVEKGTKFWMFVPPGAGSQSPLSP
jgi:two-component system cell cycle sensor histidine kinase/response regulator CckA